MKAVNDLSGLERSFFQSETIAAAVLFRLNVGEINCQLVIRAGNAQQCARIRILSQFKRAESSFPFIDPLNPRKLRCNACAPGKGRRSVPKSAPASKFLPRGDGECRRLCIGVGDGESDLHILRKIRRRSAQPIVGRAALPAQHLNFPERDRKDSTLKEF